MSYNLYYSFHQWAMRTNNPAWKPMLQRLEIMYPKTIWYVSSSVQGY